MTKHIIKIELDLEITGDIKPDQIKIGNMLCEITERPACFAETQALGSGFSHSVAYGRNDSHADLSDSLDRTLPDSQDTETREDVGETGRADIVENTNG